MKLCLRVISGFEWFAEQSQSKRRLHHGRRSGCGPMSMYTRHFFSKWEDDRFAGGEKSVTMISGHELTNSLRHTRRMHLS